MMVSIVNTNSSMFIVFISSLYILFIPSRKNNKLALSIDGLNPVMKENVRRKRKTIMCFFVSLMFNFDSSFNIIILNIPT